MLLTLLKQRGFHLSLHVLSLSKNECISIFPAFSIKWNEASISAMEETLTLNIWYLEYNVLLSQCFVVFFFVLFETTPATIDLFLDFLLCCADCVDFEWSLLHRGSFFMHVLFLCVFYPGEKNNWVKVSQKFLLKILFLTIVFLSLFEICCL